MGLLPTNPSGSQIKDEFGTARFQSFSGSLRAAYIHVIAPITSGVSNLGDFAGYGRAELSSVGATNGSNPKDVTFNFTVFTGNLQTTVVIQRDTDSAFSSPTTIATLGYGPTAGGSKSESYAMPDYSTTYYFRIFVYNAFNDPTQDWIAYPSATATYSVQTGAQPTLAAPSIYDKDMILVSGTRYDIRIFFSIGSVIPDNYTGKVRIDGGSWITCSQNNLTNISGNDWRIDLLDTNLAFSGGESVDVELTAQKSGYTSATGSTSFTAQALEPPINPTLTQPDSQTAEVQLTWGRDALSSSAYVEIEWYVNSAYHSTDTITVSNVTSMSKTFSDNDSVYVKIRYTSGLDTSWNTSSVLTIDVVIPLETGTTQSATFVEDDSFLAKVDIDTPLNDSPVDVYYEYWEGHSTIPDQSTLVRTLTSQTFTTGGTKTRTITGLDPSQTYSYRAVLVNGGGENLLNVQFFTTTAQAPATPSINSTIDNGYNFDEGGYEIAISFSNLTSGATYEGSYSKDNGATWSAASQLINMSLPYNNNQAGDLICTGELNKPDRVRMRAVNNGIASNWSGSVVV